MAISAGQRQRDGEVSWSLWNSCDDVVIIRLGGNRDYCVVSEAIRAGRKLHVNDPVHMAVLEFLANQVIAYGQRLRNNGMSFGRDEALS